MPVPPALRASPRAASISLRAVAAVARLTPALLAVFGAGHAGLAVVNVAMSF